MVPFTDPCCTVNESWLPNPVFLLQWCHMNIYEEHPERFTTYPLSSATTTCTTTKSTTPTATSHICRIFLDVLKILFLHILKITFDPPNSVQFPEQQLLNHLQDLVYLKSISSSLSTSQIVKYICINILNIFVSNFELYLSRTRKLISI